VITVYCKVLLQHTAGGNEENHQKSASNTIPIEHFLDVSQKILEIKPLSGGINF
jgi:hypothetical protein